MNRMHQHGLSLISLLVALTIGAFLLAGLFDLWLQTRKTFGAQEQLAQLQDNQRLAMTLIANTVQTAGYYPLWQNYSPTPPATPYSLLSAFPPAAPFDSQQYIHGQSNANAQGDTLSVRFVADDKVSTLDCQGQQEKNGTLVVNTYSIDANGNLQCDNGTGPMTIIAGTTSGGKLISGVASMSVLYGVDNTGQNVSANQYMSADAVNTANLWSSVRSVYITLNFLNPLFGQAGQKQYLPISRVIAVNQNAQ